MLSFSVADMCTHCHGGTWFSVLVVYTKPLYYQKRKKENTGGEEQVSPAPFGYATVVNLTDGAGRRGRLE